VEHPCYKCGANVEDGTPFCARCNAPQIRVAGPEVLAPAGTAQEVAIEHYASHAPLSSVIEWRQALLAAGISLLAAIVIIAVSKSTGLAMFAAGFLTVVLYRRRCPVTHLTAGMGARLGAFTGGLGFAALATILALWTAVRSGKEIHDAFLNYLQQNPAYASDPRMQQVIDLFNTPGGFTFIMVLTLLMTLIAFLIFSSLGGAIGAFLLHRKEKDRL
jgi:hypothetical protein